jgi:hypothetical protein
MFIITNGCNKNIKPQKYLSQGKIEYNVSPSDEAMLDSIQHRVISLFSQ